MQISTAMQNALQMNWTITDDFAVYINCVGIPLESTGGLGVQDLYEVVVKSIDLPELGSSAEAVLMAGEYRIYNAKFNPFNFS